MMAEGSRWHGSVNARAWATSNMSSSFLIGSTDDKEKLIKHWVGLAIMMISARPGWRS